MDEYGADWDFVPEERKFVTAVLPHPGHGRLIERVMGMISHCICFKGCIYNFSWRDGDVAFYEPAVVQVSPAGCCH
jgi:hypothetical protein